MLLLLLGRGVVIVEEVGTAVLLALLSKGIARGVRRRSLDLLVRLLHLWVESGHLVLGVKVVRRVAREHLVARGLWLPGGLCFPRRLLRGWVGRARAVAVEEGGPRWVVDRARQLPRDPEGARRRGRSLLRLVWRWGRAAPPEQVIVVVVRVPEGVRGRHAIRQLLHLLLHHLLVPNLIPSFLPVMVHDVSQR